MPPLRAQCLPLVQKLRLWLQQRLPRLQHLWWGGLAVPAGPLLPSWRPMRSGLTVMTQLLLLLLPLLQDPAVAPGVLVLVLLQVHWGLPGSLQPQLPALQVRRRLLLPPAAQGCPLLAQTSSRYQGAPHVCACKQQTERTQRGPNDFFEVPDAIQLSMWWPRHARRCAISHHRVLRIQGAHMRRAALAVPILYTASHLLDVLACVRGLRVAKERL